MGAISSSAPVAVSVSVSGEQPGISLVSAAFKLLALSTLAVLLMLFALSRAGMLLPDPGVWLFVSLATAGMIVPPAVFLVLYPLKRQFMANADAMNDSAAMPQHPLHIDPLTQVLNRRAITVDLMAFINHASRYGNALCVMKLDVQGLARINDEFGEDTGDAILAAVGRTLADTLRMPDRVGRHGDEEFVVVMPETDGDGATVAAGRLREAIARIAIKTSRGTCVPAINMGIAVAHGGDDLSSLLSRADKAVAAAKNAPDRLVVI